MSRRNMSERMCIGLMLCETVPCAGLKDSSQADL